jgi:hypothetical protein
MAILTEFACSRWNSSRRASRTLWPLWIILTQFEVEEIRKFAFVGARPAAVDEHAYFHGQLFTGRVKGMKETEDSASLFLALTHTALGSPKTYQKISDKA